MFLQVPNPNPINKTLTIYEATLTPECEEAVGPKGERDDGGLVLHCVKKAIVVRVPIYMLFGCVVTIDHPAVGNIHNVFESQSKHQVILEEFHRSLKEVQNLTMMGSRPARKSDFKQPSEPLPPLPSEWPFSEMILDLA